MCRAESGLYFELITGIYDVIQELVITWKEPDAQTGYDVACSASERQVISYKGMPNVKIGGPDD